MKLRKLVSVTLALLLVVSLLPVGALAADIDADRDTVTSEETFENNNATVTTNNGEIITNSGEIIKNNGTIDNNKGTVGSYVDADKKEPDTSTGNQKDGDIGGNTGTVVVNNGDIGVNGAGAQGDPSDPEIDWTNLNEDATVELNTGNIHENLGQVTQNGTGGYIAVNYGNIGANLEGAKVEQNYGKIGENSGIVNYNSSIQFVYENGGWTLTDTPAVVNNNSGTVEINDGKVNNLAGGEVKENFGSVENEAGGLLNDVILTKNPDNEEDPYPLITYQQFTGEKGTYVGTRVEQGYIETTDETTGEKQSEGFEEGGIVAVFKQAILGTVLNLNEVGKMFKKDGYEVIGYSAGPVAEVAQPDDETVEEEYPPVVYETQYTVKEGNPWLNLIWKAIAKPSGGSDGGDEPTSSGNTGRKNPPVLSSLSADKVSVGTLIRCGKVIFKIIEVNDESIRVATVDTLSQRNQEDMMGYLKQYLSADQIAKFIGQPELLDADEIAQFFKDNKAHIAFYAAKDLFEA